MCLAEFAVSYKVVSKYTKNDSEECESDDDFEENSDSEKIYLSSGLGIMKKRGKLAVLRYHKINQAKDPERYYYSQILLFKHWRKESEIYGCENYQQFYSVNIEEIIKNKNMFQIHKEIVEDALTKFQELGPPTHMFDEFASELAKQNLEDMEEEVLFDKDSSILLPSEEHQQFHEFDVQIQTNLKFGIENRPNVMKNEDYFLHVR